jgi:hypothetical protein
LAYPAQSIRSPGPEFYRPACGFKAVVLAISSGYVGIGTSCRNEAALTSWAWIGTLVMTTFDKREEAFEKKFVLDEEQKFKAEARRNKLLGLWAAEQLELSGDAAKDYAKTVVAAEFSEGGEKAVLRKVMGDLTAKDITISEAEIGARMDELMAEAVKQVKAGM